MSESNMRKRLVEVLKPLDAKPVENRCGIGTPDVNYIGGWIECKWLRAWPKRPDTPVRLDHPLTPGQRIWLRRRRRHGGTAWVMLQCKREWFLFEGVVAAQHLGTSTRQELHDMAHTVLSGLETDKLIAILTEYSDENTTRHDG